MDRRVRATVHEHEGAASVTRLGQAMRILPTRELVRLSSAKLDSDYRRFGRRFLRNDFKGRRSVLLEQDAVHEEFDWI